MCVFACVVVYVFVAKNVWVSSPIRICIGLFDVFVSVCGKFQDERSLMVCRMHESERDERKPYERYSMDLSLH